MRWDQGREIIDRMLAARQLQLVPASREHADVQPPDRDQSSPLDGPGTPQVARLIGTGPADWSSAPGRQPRAIRATTGPAGMQLLPASHRTT